MESHGFLKAQKSTNLFVRLLKLEVITFWRADKLTRYPIHGTAEKDGNWCISHNSKGTKTVKRS